MEEKREEAAVDYISKLPEPILQYLLSSLLAKDAAQLSTFSKAWNSAWSSLSYLNFGNHFFYIEEEDHMRLSENIPKLVNIVDQTLAHRQKQKISIQKFWLTLPSWHWSSYVHNWIKTLVVLNVKELNLDVSRPDGGYNTLPKEIFAAKELDVLHLRGFKLELLHDGIKFASLRVLNLSTSFLDEDFIRAICESCSGLEDLALINCKGLTRLQITGTLPKLRSVVLIDCPSEFKMVDIVAPNLEDLFIDGIYWEVELQVVINVTACKALKTLSLYHVNVTEEWLENLFSSLPNLEVLYLDYCGELRTMKISSDKLKHLRLATSDLITAELDTPNLTSFSYSTCGDQLPALKLKASILLKVELNLLLRVTLDSHWCSMLMKFLGTFRQANAIKLVCDSERGIIIPKDMRKDTVPPLYGSECLHITFHGCSESSSIVDVLDSLLWIFPQLGTLSFAREDQDIMSTLKFIYEDEKICCASLQSKWRRHKLKEVKMENFTCIEQEDLRNYLFTDAGTSEI